MTEQTRRQVVVFSFGGTKFQVGALLRDRHYVNEPEIHWRTAPEFGAAAEAGAKELVAAVTRCIVRFVEARKMSPTEIDLVGFAFPGPSCGGLWYSNNLGPHFRGGVPLASLLSEAIDASDIGPLSTAVVFDAQADAGGELYHSEGRLVGFDRDAVVLNLATGVAAGFVRDGRVLVGDELATVGGFDAGAGQLGRHLWFDESSATWSYHYRPNGAVSDNVRGQRMTDRLSGPALATRLLPHIKAYRGDEALAPLLERYGELEGDAALDSVRADPKAIRTLLSWANDVVRDARHPAAEFVEAYSAEIARDLVGALGAWMQVPAWRSFSKQIVLTGGIGIHFLASPDGRDSFLQQLAAGLPDCEISRSRLTNSIERESYLFCRQ